MWVMMPLFLHSARFETERAIVHTRDGFCGRAEVAVADGQVTVRCDESSSRSAWTVHRRGSARSQVLDLPVPLVVAVPAREQEAFAAALAANGISVRQRPD